MPYVLGIDIGGTTTTAAVSRWRGEGWSAPEPVRLTAQGDSVASALHVAVDRTLTVAEPAPRETDRVARGFSRRIGDEVPMMVAGEPCPPQALTAAFAMWVVEQVLAQEGEPADQVVIGHPASWGAHRRALLHQALRDIGLHNVSLLPEPVLAAESHTEGGLTGDVFAVYSLGGTDFAASVVRRTGPNCFRLVATASLPDQFGGADLDEALANLVAGRLGGRLRALGNGAHARLARHTLRRECVGAKELLSSAAEAEVDVPASAGSAPVRVSRAEFMELIRPALQVTVELLAGTVRSAGIDEGTLDGVLLVGGATQTPLIAELVAARLAAPVAAPAQPQATAAYGAAVVAGKIVSPPPPPHQQPLIRRPEPPTRDRPGAESPDEAASRELDASPPPRPPVKIAPLKLSRMRSRNWRFGLVGGSS